MMSLRQLMATFPTDEACKAFVQERRWPNGVRCPRCGNDKIWALKSRPFHWVCKGKECGGTKNPYRFSVLVGTIFENTNYSLKTWFEVLWQMLNSKKGVSALQIQRQIQCGSYRTAWYMCHRLRAGMADPDFKQLIGIVEVDETYIGGKAKNRHGRGVGGGKKVKEGGTGKVGKVGVIGAIARKGSVVCQVIEKADTQTLEGFVREVVADNVSLVATDEYVGYKHLAAKGYPHETVSHTRGEYVRGDVHTANLDSFWSLLKRGVVGTYHKVSKKYLPLYLNEFTFRHNNRKNADMFGAAIAAW